MGRALAALGEHRLLHTPESDAESLLEETLETLIASGAEDFEVQRVRSKLETLKSEQDSADAE